MNARGFKPDIAFARDWDLGAAVFACIPQVFGEGRPLMAWQFSRTTPLWWSFPLRGERDVSDKVVAEMVLEHVQEYDAVLSTYGLVSRVIYSIFGESHGTVEPIYCKARRDAVKQPPEQDYWGRLLGVLREMRSGNLAVHFNCDIWDNPSCHSYR